jgi:hypothetical protein
VSALAMPEARPHNKTIVRPANVVEQGLHHVNRWDKEAGVGKKRDADPAAAHFMHLKPSANCGEGIRYFASGIPEDRQAGRR